MQSQRLFNMDLWLFSHMIILETCKLFTSGQFRTYEARTARLCSHIPFLSLVSCLSSLSPSQLKVRWSWTCQAWIVRTCPSFDLWHKSESLCVAEKSHWVLVLQSLLHTISSFSKLFLSLSILLYTCQLFSQLISFLSYFAKTIHNNTYVPLLSIFQISLELQAQWALDCLLNYHRWQLLNAFSPYSPINQTVLFYY